MAADSRQPYHAAWDSSGDHPMRSEFDFLLRHGYAVLFVLVPVDQLGVPLPATPFLVAAGAYAASGHLDLVRIGSVTVAASLVAHVFWYEFARRSRADILGLLCRVSLEPDCCARRAGPFPRSTCSARSSVGMARAGVRACRCGELR
jgi:hypothetical protein